MASGISWKEFEAIVARLQRTFNKVFPSMVHQLSPARTRMFEGAATTRQKKSHPFDSFAVAMASTA
jgi:hypothetical protein